MPSIGVESAVEKALSGAPKAKAEEIPDPKAPVEKPSEKVVETPEEHSSNGELTAFEQELITEYQDEYDSLGTSDKTAFLNALKRSYRKQAKQMTELGSMRKALGTLRDAGVTNEDLVELVNRKRGKAPAAESGKEAVRGFKRFLSESTDPAERENLTKAEQVVREVVEDLLESHFAKEVKPLRDELEANKRLTVQRRQDSLAQEISDLEDKLGYPGSVVETYRADIEREGLRYPSKSAEKLLFEVADPKDLKAVMAKANGHKAEDHPKPKADAPVIKKPAQAELPRKSRGAISITGALETLLRKK